MSERPAAAPSGKLWKKFVNLGMEESIQYERGQALLCLELAGCIALTTGNPLVHIQVSGHHLAGARGRQIGFEDV